MSEKYGSGALLSPPDKRDYRISRCMDIPAGGADGVIPRNFECWIPKEIHDQGETASCTAFAMSTIFSCIWHKLTGEDRNFSTGYIYGNNLGDCYQGTGAYMRDVAKTVTKHGDILSALADSNDEKPEAFRWFEKIYPKFKAYSKLLVKEYVRISDASEARAFMYKYKIPLFCSLRLGDISPLSSNPDGLHAVAMYKYSFNFGFACRNSWGKNNIPNLDYRNFKIFKEVWGMVPNENISFTDVEKDRWSYDAINEAAADGIVEGFPDNTFCPDRALTREQIAVIWERMKRYMDENYRKADK